MSADAHDLLEALSSAGVTIEARNGRLYYRPRSALTTEMLSAVKSCKAGLLEILKSSSPSAKGLGAEGSLFSPNAPGTQARPIETLAQTPAAGESRADREWARFLSVAVAMADGSGWFDPTAEPVPAGVPIEAWRAFERDCARLGKAVRA